MVTPRPGEGPVPPPEYEGTPPPKVSQGVSVACFGWWIALLLALVLFLIWWWVVPYRGRGPAGTDVTPPPRTEPAQQAPAGARG